MKPWFVFVFMCLGVSCSALRGPQGETGAQGLPCSVAATSDGAEIMCPDGSTAYLYNGVGGESCTVTQISTGAEISCPGSNSVDVANGNGVTPIQLCPSTFEPVYPTEFPEYGLQIGGQLYGVYSANGGFLALLPPGQYSSDGVGASCTFTVNADGTVSN